MFHTIGETQQTAPQISDQEALLAEIRSDRERAISLIPSLISLPNNENEALLLVIYNLYTNGEKFEYMSLGNRPSVLCHSLRLFTENTQAHDDGHIKALEMIVAQADSPELLIELAYAIYACSKSCDAEVQNALDEIAAKATARLYPDVLLMLQTINALRCRQQTG